MVSYRFIPFGYGFFSAGWVGCRKIRWEYDSTTTKAISGRRARPWTVLLQRRLPFVGDSFRVASFLSELKLFVALGMGAMLCSHIFKRFSNYDTLVWSDATGLAVPMCHSQKHHSYFFTRVLLTKYFYPDIISSSNLSQISP